MKTKKNLIRLTSLILSLVLTLCAAPHALAADSAYADVSDGTYVISSKADSNYVLDIYGDITKSKNNVQIYTNVGNQTQMFQFTKTSGGWYSLVPQSNTSLSVNPYSDHPKSGTNINVYKVDHSDKTQGFYFKEVDGCYAILSAYNTELAVTIEGKTLKNFVNIRLEKYDGRDTQLWKLNAVDESASPAGFNDEDAKSAVKAIGKQTDKDAWKMMCASICVSYANHLKSGLAYTPEQSSDKNGLAVWSKCGGKDHTSKNTKDLLAKVKAQLDAGGLAIVHVYSSYGQHWVLAYRYTGSGTETGDFKVVDPWNGTLLNLGQNYSLNSSGRVILC